MYDSYIHTAHIRLHTSVSIRSTVQYVYTYSDTTTKTTILNDAYIRQYNTEKRTVRTAKCTKIKWWSESNAISGGKIMIKVEADVFEYYFFWIIDQGIHSVVCWMLRSIECGRLVGCLAVNTNW